jgi:predicted secreted protein
MIMAYTPAAPFEPLHIKGESVTVNTEGKILVLPTGNADILPSFNEYTLNSNRLTILESPFGGLKGSGSPDFGVGTVLVQTDGCYLSDINGQNTSKILSAGKLKELNCLTVDATAHSITEEFIIKNTSVSNNPSVVDNCDVTTGWSLPAGTLSSITVENGRLKVIGTSDASTGYFIVQKDLTPNLTSYPFIGFSIESSVSGSARLRIQSGSSFKIWQDAARFPLSANSNKTFIFPIDTPQGTTGQYPSTVSGSLSKNGITMLSIGAIVAPNTPITMYIDTIFADVAKPCYLEIFSNDYLADTSTVVQYYTGSTYETALTCKLDNGFTSVSADNTKGKLLDGTLLNDCYGAGNGRSIFPKGVSAETKTGSLSNSSISYSAYKGTKYRIGLRVDLPPLGSNSNFSAVRLKITTFYTYPKGTTTHMGSTTFEFSDDNSASTGLQNLAKPFIALLDAPRTDILPDSSGQGNNGVMSNVTMASDSGGNPYGAMRFNGSSSQVNCGNGSSLNLTTEATICARIKLNNKSSNGIISKRSVWNSLTGYSFFVNNNASLTFEYGNGTNTLQTTWNTGSQIQDTWAFVAVVVSGKNITRYFNSVSHTMSTGLDNGIAISTDNLIIGAGTGMALSGLVSDLSIYNRALTSNEITAIRNGQAVSNTGLVASWKPYQPSNKADFFLSTYRPKKLIRRRDESGSVYELELYPGNGSLYHGSIFHCNPSLDTDSDLIPDVLKQNLHFATQDGQLFTASDGAYFDVPMTTLNGSLFQFLQSYGMLP